MDINTKFQQYNLANHHPEKVLLSPFSFTDYLNRQKHEKKPTVYHRIHQSTPQTTAKSHRNTGVNTRDV